MKRIAPVLALALIVSGCGAGIGRPSRAEVYAACWQDDPGDVDLGITLLTEARNIGTTKGEALALLIDDLCISADADWAVCRDCMMASVDHIWGY